MKQIYLGLLLLFAINLNAQQQLTQISSDAEKAPFSPTRGGGSNPSTLALFDIQFNYNIQPVAGGGNAGVVFTGTEFWVSRWQSDTIFSFSPSGAITDTFQIAGVSGVRAMAFDGTLIYAGTNTSTIQKIDPASKTVVGTISVSGTNVRHISYDPTANSGAGGFWIGNFNTDLKLIDMNGNQIGVIPAATHGLTEMYGSAYDPYTAGGPYLWIFDQGGASNARLVRLQLPNGNQTGVIHDVMTDVGASLTSGLAGGLFITNQLGSIPTIVGLLQGTPTNMLFGYELNDFILPSNDASLDSLVQSNPFVQIPLIHVTPITFQANATNAGAATITTGEVAITVTKDGSQQFFESVPFGNLAPGNTEILNTGDFTAADTGTYKVTGVVTITGSQTDSKNTNDTLTYNLMVTDTVFARENGKITGSLGIGSGSGGTLGHTFTTTVQDSVTSITMYLNSPTAGDTVEAGIYSFTTTPGAKLAGTAQYIIKAADTNGVELTLPIIGGPFKINAGTYFVGVTEHMENVTLATTTFNFREKAGWVKFGTTPWTPIEAFDFKVTFYLRMNVVGKVLNTTAINSGSSQTINIYPNPVINQLNIEGENLSNLTFQVINTLGEVVIENKQVLTGKLDVSTLPAGAYLLKTSNGGTTSAVRFIKAQ